MPSLRLILGPEADSRQGGAGVVYDQPAQRPSSPLGVPRHPRRSAVVVQGGHYLFFFGSMVRLKEAQTHALCEYTALLGQIACLGLGKYITSGGPEGAIQGSLLHQDQLLQLKLLGFEVYSLKGGWVGS